MSIPSRDPSFQDPSKKSWERRTVEKNGWDDHRCGGGLFVFSGPRFKGGGPTSTIPPPSPPPPPPPSPPSPPSPPLPFQDYALEPEEASRLVRQLRGGYRERLGSDREILAFPAWVWVKMSRRGQELDQERKAKKEKNTFWGSPKTHTCTPKPIWV